MPIRRNETGGQALPYTLRHLDFDGDLFAGREVRVVDCGDLVMAPAGSASGSGLSVHGGFGRYSENTA